MCDPARPCSLFWFKNVSQELHEMQCFRYSPGFCVKSCINYDEFDDWFARARARTFIAMAL
jgi:hypothetical protein